MMLVLYNVLINGCSWFLYITGIGTRGERGRRRRKEQGPPESLMTRLQVIYRPLEVLHKHMMPLFYLVV